MGSSPIDVNFMEERADIKAAHQGRKSRKGSCLGAPVFAAQM